MQQMGLDIKNENNTFDEVCDILGCENNTPGWPDVFGNAMRKWIWENKVKPIKTLSLFSGAGGLDIGFADLGFDIIASVEIEPKFCKTLELNSNQNNFFQHTKVNCVDIKDFTSDSVGEVDFIIGGPPCQTFSAAGRRANGVIGINDSRGTLFREYVRLLKEVSPKGFLFENVYGIIGAQKGEAWREILDSFSEIGYKLFYRIIDAADYGVPQHRERLLIVGLKDGVFNFPRPTHGPDSIDHAAFYNAETAIEGIKSNESDESNKLMGRYASLLLNIPPGLNYSFYTEKMGHPNPIFAWRSKFSDFLYKADPNTPVRTIKASGGAYTGPLHWDNRFFKLEEYKRLQTFPDSYLISGNKQTAVKQIGNSVPPQLARIMAIAIREQVFGTSFPFRLSTLSDKEKLTFRKRKREISKFNQKKAEEAIKNLKNKIRETPSSRTYYCSIDNLFDYKEVSKEISEYKVNVDWNNSLKIFISLTDKYPVDESTIITITPNGKRWFLGVDSVNMIINAPLNKGLTIAWKAFERELITNNIKADLVQLNGYYQYPSNLNITAHIPEGEKYSDVLKSILSGKNVANIITESDLATSWDVSIDEIIDVAKYLNSLGYEIRNHSTNPQIDKGMWLLPYAFPTLCPLSVQLRKNLR